MALFFFVLQFHVLCFGHPLGVLIAAICSRFSQIFTGPAAKRLRVTSPGCRPVFVEWTKRNWNHFYR